MTDPLQSSLAAFNLSSQRAFEASQQVQTPGASSNYEVEVAEYRVKTQWPTSPAIGDVVERYTTYSATNTGSAIVAVQWKNELGQAISAPPSYSVIERQGSTNATALNQLEEIVRLTSIDDRMLEEIGHLSTIKDRLVGANRAMSMDTFVVTQEWFSSPTVGTVVTRVLTWDLSTHVASIFSVVWMSGYQIIATPPGDAYYTPISTSSGGNATALNQVTMIGYLTEIAQSVGRYSSYKVQQTEENPAGTTYIRKAGANAADTWLIVRSVETASSSAVSYAGIRNNPSVATGGAAWSQRTSLVYGDIGSA